MHYFVRFQMHNKRLQPGSFIIWVQSYLFLETKLLQSETFLTMFNTVNISPLAIAKLVFMPTIILNNYQQCLVPLIVANNSYFFLKAIMKKAKFK